jgi:hypothetical protein
LGLVVPRPFVASETARSIAASSAGLAMLAAPSYVAPLARGRRRYGGGATTVAPTLARVTATTARCLPSGL